MTPNVHPLAPLTEEELRKARDLVLKLYEDKTIFFFRSVYLEEPKKVELKTYLSAEHAGTLSADTPRPPPPGSPPVRCHPRRQAARLHPVGRRP